jgi:biotin-(acetyl-CoA carboxylase) ligase
LLEEWRRRDALLGRRVQVFAGPGRQVLVAEGEAAGVGGKGQLLVRHGDGAVAEVFAGDASVATT